MTDEFHVGLVKGGIVAIAAFRINLCGIFSVSNQPL